MTVKLLGNEESISGSLGATDRFDLYRYQCTTSGRATEFRIKKGSASGNVKVNVYADDDGDPGSLLWSNDNDNAVDESTEIITIDVPFCVTAGEYYWLGFNQETANTVSYHTSSSGYRYYKAETYSTFEAPNPAGTGFTKTYVILARMSLYGETGTTYRSLTENGGGDIAYLWHVAGYPWAVTDNPELITALSNTSNTTVQAARKRLFGTNEFTLSTTVTPAYSVPIFPGLIRDFGKSKWSMDESRGLLKGGDWKVKIEDRDHGHTWAHAASGDEIWGLEGLHRIARIKESSVHGWGYLDENFVITSGGLPGDLNINEETNNRLYNRIDGCSGDEWLPLWINHECVATSNVTGTAPSYEIGILGGAVAGGGRGLYRSRPQDHFTAVLKSLDPIVADVPGGVAGKYCWLYAIPLHEGSVMTRSDDEPIIAEIESGVITPNIRTKNSVTEVSIRGATSSLDRTVSVERTRATESSLAGFVFSRGVSGTDYTEDDLIGHVQAPHLTIREFKGTWADISTVCGFERLSEDDDYDYMNAYLKAESNYVERYIWICGKNEIVVFNTAEEVVNALNDELNACHNGLDSRYSEGTTLSHEYEVIFQGGMFSLRSLDDNYDRRWGLINDNPVFPPEYVPSVLFSKFTGPLAWVFYLGDPLVASDNLYYKLRNSHFNYQLLETMIPIHEGARNQKSDSVYPYIPGDSDRYWMGERGVRNGFIDNIQNMFGETEGAIPIYYYQWDHANSPINNDHFDQSQDNYLVNAWPLPRQGNWPITGGYLFLPEGTDLNSFVDGEKITIGDGRIFPKLHGEVESLENHDNYDLEALDIDGNLLTDTGTEIVRGTSLFYLPMMEYYGRDEEGINSIRQLDSHYIYKAAAVRSNTLSRVIRKLLGDSNITELNLAKELQHTSNPFFTTTGDFISQIDWDSLDELMRVDGIYYNVDFGNTDSISKIFKNEILFHAAHMTREWDDSDQMWKFRFRPIGPPNKSEAWSLGYRLTEAKTQEGAPYETHGFSDLYNAIKFKIPSHADDYETTFEQKNASIVGTDERRTLEIKPSISRIYGFSFFSIDLLKHFTNLLNAISTPSVVQTKKTTTMQQLFPVGREILVTDSTAREPYTHARGLTTEPALVVGVSFDIAKQKGELSYRIGGPGESTTSGYAPSCYLTTGNFTQSVGSLSGTPEDHTFTSTRQANDVYYFDCFDLYDPSNPKARDCSCSDYKVWVHEQGTYNWTPLEFTCSVSASTGVITFTGDTTNIDTSKNYYVTFREWADLEDCQKVWCTHADDNNTIGSANLPAHRWG